MPRVTIAGLGLIGGSLGMALRRRGWSVAYLDPAVSLEDARAAGAADDRIESAEDAEMLVLATPVDVAIELLHRTRANVITSVCSVMEPLVRAAGKSRFIAGHPFAGSEKSGLEAASADLFGGKTWFISAHDDGVTAMIEAAGARGEVIDAAEHDRILAMTSHLPQLLSTALASMIERHGIDDRFVGSGLRTFLRLAGSSFDVWRPVLEANRGNVAAALDELAQIAEQIDERDFDRAQRWAGRGTDRKDIDGR